MSAKLASRFLNNLLDDIPPVVSRTYKVDGALIIAADGTRGRALSLFVRRSAVLDWFRHNEPESLNRILDIDLVALRNYTEVIDSKTVVVSRNLARPTMPRDGRFALRFPLAHHQERIFDWINE